MTPDDILPYCRARLSELESYVEDGTPWGFVCLASYTDFLAKLADGEDMGGDGYKRLVETYFPEAYRDFCYTDPDETLHYQMYHIFRCGLVHSLSLFPDANRYTNPNPSNQYQGRPRSVLLTHDGKTADGTEYPHLSLYSDGELDAAVIHASNLYAELKLVTEDVLATPATRETAFKWVSLSWPIGCNVI